MPLHVFIQIHVCKDTFTSLCMVSCFSADGTDFIASAPMFNFGMGPLLQACIDVTIIDDDDLEGDHTFTVELGATSLPALGGTGSPTSTTITIQDPEGSLYTCEHKIDDCTCELFIGTQVSECLYTTHFEAFPP